MPDNENSVKEIRDLAISMQEVEYVESIPFIKLPPGYTQESLEQYFSQPVRQKRKVLLQSIDDLIQYIKTNQTDILIQGQIYIDLEQYAIKTIMDAYSRNNDATETTMAWCDHVVTYFMKKSNEWMTWTAMENLNTFKSQWEFAEFIEDNIDDIVSPPGAEMLEIVKSMQAKKNVDFNSAIRMDNGSVKFDYTEEVQGTCKQSSMDIPENFEIGIKPFEHGKTYLVKSRLRYRLTGSELKIKYIFNNTDKIVEDALNEIMVRLKEETPFDVYMGAIK